MIAINVNDYQFLVSKELSLIETCKFIGIMIPRFCYHEKLSVAASCRMCVVEVEKVLKPVTACSAELTENLSIYTNTPFVKKARENILEALLLNHPLDCPICDQAGECDLQDQVKAFGSFYTRFYGENKRSVEDKNCGPLIKTIMTRCIHCTRCVRFGSEIAGIDLGTLNRGISTEIGSYISKMFTSEISGNVIDLCPVGALTAQPHAFRIRPWELRTLDSVDTLDSFGTNIYLNYKESEITRILPKINEDLNENLISDKTRFAFDALSSKNKLQKITYKTIDVKSKSKKTIVVDRERTLFLINEMIDLELLILVKKLTYLDQGIELRSLESFNKINNFNIFWDFNKIRDIQLETKECFLFTSNIRVENTLLSTKLRVKFLNKNFNVFSMGIHTKTTFQTRFLNVTLKKIIYLLEGKDKNYSSNLFIEPNPLFFFGDSFSRRCSISATFFINFLRFYLPTAILFNVNLHSNTSSVHSLCIKPIDKNVFNKSCFYTLSTLDVNFNIKKIIDCHSISNTNKVILTFNSFQTFCNNILNSFHMDVNPTLLTIPALHSLEFEGIYLNLEGRPQQTQSLNSTDSTSFLKIFLIKFFFDKKGFISQNQIVLNTKKREFLSYIPVRAVNTLAEFSYLFELIDKYYLFDSVTKDYSVSNFLRLHSYTKYFKCFKYPFKSSIDDFYTTNTFLRHSPTMLKCSREFRKLYNNF